MATNTELRRSDGINFNERINVSTHWSLIEGKPTTFVPTAHPHNLSDIVDFPAWSKKATLDANDIPTLGIGKISGLQGALDSKASNIHTHSQTNIFDVRQMSGNGGGDYLTLTPNNKLFDRNITPIFSFVNGAGPSWRSILNIKGWTGSYASWQLIGNASTTTDNNLYFRTGIGDTWNTPLAIYHEGNKPKAADIGASPVGHKHSAKDITSDVLDPDRIPLLNQSKIDGLVTDLEAIRTNYNSKANVIDVYTKTEVDNKLTSAMRYKGTRASYAHLPISGNEVGDFWNVTDTGINYAWTGSSWDKVGGVTDLSGLEPKINTGTATQFWRGDKTWTELNTGMVNETTTRKYITQTLLDKLNNISSNAKKVENSTTNGNIKIDDVETAVYTHPSSHPASMIAGTFLDSQIPTLQQSKISGLTTSLSSKVTGNNGGIRLDGIEVYNSPRELPDTKNSSVLYIVLE